MRALAIAATGLAAQQLHVDTISQNLANSSTTGYKSARPEFQDLIYQDQKRVGTNSTDQGTTFPVGIQIGLGVKTSGISRTMTQGSVAPTDNSLDLAIQGKGYFQIELPDGTLAYSRDGSLKLSPDGTIVTSQGFTVQPAITIPTNAVSVAIDSSGEVSVTLQGQADPQQLGQFQLATFVNPAGLEATGDNLLTATTASGAALVNNPGLDSTGTILQGYLESSNVDSVSEMTGLIDAQRVYEMNTKVLTAADQMLQSLNQSA
jgi:flagellar basal-body rod protein FlgG